jgi:hypothetical protein
MPREGHEDREEDERGTGKLHQGFLVMKDRIFRLSITVTAIVATLLAGSASIKGF